MALLLPDGAWKELPALLAQYIVPVKLGVITPVNRETNSVRIYPLERSNCLESRSGQTSALVEAKKETARL